MRLVYGLKEGLEALARRRQGEVPLPPAVAERLREALGASLTPREAVSRILEEVRARGDEALQALSHSLDGFVPPSWEVPREGWARARRALPRPLLRALEQAARRVEAFHRMALPRPWVDLEQGFGQTFVPLQRVGIYIPGGTAVYPSTVLMTAIPARVAGVEEVVVCTPPRGPQGPHPAVLAAAEIAGVDRVFQVGGAQAIGAMAYGTASIPRVDMVCGPGNIFVALAKRMVMGEVAVDGIYGPTETVVVADGTADPRLCAADLVAQAEHDPMASPIFITTSPRTLERVLAEVERQIRRLPRQEIARASLEANGVAVVVDTLEEALHLANHYAPEHLCLSVARPWEALPLVRNAGGVFLGEASPESVGDYLAGPSHAMPTGGTARFASALGVHHFLKPVPLIALTPALLERLARNTSTLARAEGLEGHARAVEARLRRRRKEAR